jgi:hypothetical protein
MNCMFLNHSVYLSVVAFCRKRNASVCPTHPSHVSRQSAAGWVDAAPPSAAGSEGG